MLTPLLGAILWVLAATVTAFLPMRQQMVPGLVLLILAPVILVWLGLAYGWLAVGLGLIAFASMYRRPLAHAARRLAGRPAQARSGAE